MEDAAAAAVGAPRYRDARRPSAAALPGRLARGAEDAQAVVGQGAREAKLGEIDLEVVFETA